MTKAFVLFEAMNHMTLVLKEARARGFRIVLLNHNPVNQTGPYAVTDDEVDETVHIEAWEDREAVERVLADVHARYEVVGTYACFEAAMPYEATLREMAGLPNNGADNVRFVLDKLALRRKLYAEGLSGLRSASLDEALQWERWPFDGSAILKPVNGTGSALCYTVASTEELRHIAARLSDTVVINPLMREYIAARGEFLVEEKAAGELLSVESLVYHGEVHTIGLQGRYVLVKDPVVEMGVVFPFRHARMDEIVAKSEAIHRSLSIHHGPTHLEMMVPKQGPIELIDFNIRFTGVDSLICFNEAFGIRFEKCLTDLACDIDPDLSFLDGPSKVAANMLLMPPPGTTVLESLDFPPEAVFSRLTKEIGQQLSGNVNQLDMLGLYVVKADTIQELHQKVLAAQRRAVVNGQPLGDNVNNLVAFNELAAQ